MTEQSEQRETYKFTSSKGGQNTELIDMGDGRVAAQGQEVELTEAEADALKATVNLRKSSDDSGADKSDDSAKDSHEDSLAANVVAGRGNAR